MVARISPQQFNDSEGVGGWEAFDDRASTTITTGSFSKGVALVDEIGRLADAANHHPDVDLRYGSVTVRLSTHDVGGLSERDVNLARQISAAARQLGLT